MMTTRTILTIVWVGEIRQGNMFDTKTRSKRWYTVCLSQCTVCAGPIDMVHCVPTTICAERQYVQHKNILDIVQTVPFTDYHICAGPRNMVNCVPFVQKICMAICSAQTHPRQGTQCTFHSVLITICAVPRNMVHSAHMCAICEEYSKAIFSGNPDIVHHQLSLTTFVFFCLLQLHWCKKKLYCTFQYETVLYIWVGCY